MTSEKVVAGATTYSCTTHGWTAWSPCPHCRAEAAEKELADLQWQTERTDLGEVIRERDEWRKLAKELATRLKEITENDASTLPFCDQPRLLDKAKKMGLL